MKKIIIIIIGVIIIVVGLVIFSDRVLDNVLEKESNPKDLYLIKRNIEN